MPLIRKEPPSGAAGHVPDDLTALRDGDPQRRWAAARGLGGRPDAAAALGAALGGERDERVREAILTSLVRIGGVASVEAILPHLRSDDANLRTGALDALRALMPAAQTMLPALLADRDPDIRVLSCDLARELPSGEATRLLCEVLERDAEANVCAAAVDVLADIGEPLCLPSLRRCARRFTDSPFLAFAVEVASQRIAAPRPPAHG